MAGSDDPARPGRGGTSCPGRGRTGALLLLVTGGYKEPTQQRGRNMPGERPVSAARRTKWRTRRSRESGGTECA